MEKSFKKVLKGHHIFRKKYAAGDSSIMQALSRYGQKPRIMIVACCDARVDPALILQCDPGDLFVVRNVANIIPPYEKDLGHHGTSAALEFGITFLNIKNLVIIGHSQCGGIEAAMSKTVFPRNDFISDWVALIKTDHESHKNSEAFAKEALKQSRMNSMSFPWIKERVSEKQLFIHLWFFDIKTGNIFSYSEESHTYIPLDVSDYGL